ncbi:MAG: hypothetical protein PHQ12_11920 [Chthoniobacteraceae bacterium]|nr:hypothetical protein [Chthoniobacteraceae bacterium]
MKNKPQPLLKPLLVLVLSIALLALALFGGGCATANSVAKGASNGIAQIFEAAAKNTNTFVLHFNGWGASIDLSQNAAVPPITRVPAGTLQVNPAPLPPVPVH